MKLVRNHVPQLYDAGELEPKGTDRNYTFHQASRSDLKMLLRLKLAEEVGEILSAPDHNSLMDEIGDLMLVLDTLRALEGETHEDQQRRVAKKKRLGGFANGWVLE